MCCATINCPNNPKILAGTLSTMRSVKEAVADVQRRVFLLEGFVSSTPDPVVVCSACYNYPQNVHDTGLVHKEETLSAAQRVQLASIEYFGRRLLRCARRLRRCTRRLRRAARQRLRDPRRIL